MVLGVSFFKTRDSGSSAGGDVLEPVDRGGET